MGNQIIFSPSSLVLQSDTQKSLVMVVSFAVNLKQTPLSFCAHLHHAAVNQEW